MEEVPDRVADGVDHPETIILGDKVFSTMLLYLTVRGHTDG